MFRKERDEMGSAFFDWVASEVASVEPSDSSLIFLPFVYGSNCGAVQSGFYGISSKHTSAHLLTALFEGVVFAHYQHFNRLLHFRSKPDTIRFTGGAARSDVWCQLFADCMGIHVPKHPSCLCPSIANVAGTGSRRCAGGWAGIPTIP